ncbi:MAG: DMT family transporter, partial [Bdellovibrionales bacterium]|nr:DMT family transporter [Bdellovibrionales bacterium]
PFCFDGNAFNANWLVLITLGVFQLALPYIIYARAIKSVRAAEAVVIQTLEPVLNPVWVAIAIGELPGPYGILGGVLVLGAVTAQGVLGARRHLTLKKT